MTDSSIDYDYEDLCTECDRHNICHKNSIDYDEIDKCNGALVVKWEQVKPHKMPEPKEKVCFT